MKLFFKNIIIFLKTYNEVIYNIEDGKKMKKQQNVKRYDMQFSYTEKEKFKTKFTAWLQQL